LNDRFIDEHEEALGCFGFDVNFAALELDFAVGQGEERIIAANTHVEAGAEACSALADDDRSGGDELPAIRFDATVLRIAVAAISGGTLTLFVCHEITFEDKKIIHRCEREKTTPRQRGR
jgi:hypothetical protein